MQAIVKSIEVKKVLNRYYLKIVMESQNKQFVLDNPLINDPINFRRELFGILTACNCYDLMRLAREVPVPKEATGYYTERAGYEILENKSGNWLAFNRKTERYTCEKADENLKKFIQMAQDYHVSAVDVNEGTIESIQSRSSVFSIMFQGKIGVSFFTTKQIYWGFGHPINIGNSNDKKGTLKSANMFTSFIVSLMKFFEKDNLLEIGGDIKKYPEVEITLDHSNRVSVIKNAVTGKGFCIGRNYEMIDPMKGQEQEKAN